MDQSNRQQTNKGPHEVRNRPGKFRDIMNMKEEYILQQGIDFFGKSIPQGTRYIRKGTNYWPVIDDEPREYYQVSQIIVHDNMEYFLPPGEEEDAG